MLIGLSYFVSVKSSLGCFAPRNTMTRSYSERLTLSRLPMFSKSMKAHVITQRPVFDANQKRIHEIGERSIVIITITKYQQSPDTWETPYTQKTLSQHLPHASPSASPFHPDIWGT